MKTLKIQDQIVLLDDEDFDRLLTYAWYIDSNGYVRRTDYTEGKIYKNRKKPLKIIKIHKQILNYWGNLEIDHIDGNKLNNQKTNLRIVSKSENQLNRVHLNKNNSSGIRGVSFNKWGKKNKRWMARFKQIYLGSFLTKEEAEREVLLKL